jgi:hypothetical protein
MVTMPSSVNNSGGFIPPPPPLSPLPWLPDAAWGSITREQKTELMQSALHHRENLSSLLPPCFSKEDEKCNNDDTPQDRIVLGHGPRRVLILVGVHGNEYCGVHAVREILGRFCLFHGMNRITKSDLQDDSYWDDEPLSALFDLLTIEFVVGNPQACQNSVRFLKKNLNRMFDMPILLDEDQRSIKEGYEYELQRARVVMESIRQADFVLDIHSCSADSLRN